MVVIAKTTYLAVLANVTTNKKRQRVSFITPAQKVRGSPMIGIQLPNRVAQPYRPYH